MENLQYDCKRKDETKYNNIVKIMHVGVFNIIRHNIILVCLFTNLVALVITEPMADPVSDFQQSLELGIEL